MTNATVLADALVDEFFGGDIWKAIEFIDLEAWAELHGEDAAKQILILDWRVAGKVLESMVSFDADATDKWTISVWLSGAFTGPSATTGNESLPRAICEAWYESQKPDMQNEWNDFGPDGREDSP